MFVPQEYILVHKDAWATRIKCNKKHEIGSTQKGSPKYALHGTAAHVAHTAEIDKNSLDFAHTG